MTNYTICSEQNLIKSFQLRFNVIKESIWVENKQFLGKLKAGTGDGLIFFVIIQENSKLIEELVLIIRDELPKAKIIYFIDTRLNVDIESHKHSPLAGDVYLNFTASEAELLEKMSQLLPEENLVVITSDKTLEDLALSKANHSIEESFSLVFGKPKKDKEVLKTSAKELHTEKVIDEFDIGDIMGDQEKDLSLDDLGELELGAETETLDASQAPDDGSLEMPIDQVEIDLAAPDEAPQNGEPPSMDLDLGSEPSEISEGVDLSAAPVADEDMSNDALAKLKEIDELMVQDSSQVDLSAEGLDGDDISLDEEGLDISLGSDSDAGSSEDLSLAGDSGSIEEEAVALSEDDLGFPDEPPSQVADSGEELNLGGEELNLGGDDVDFNLGSEELKISSDDELNLGGDELGLGSDELGLGSDDLGLGDDVLGLSGDDLMLSADEPRKLAKEEKRQKEPVTQKSDDELSFGVSDELISSDPNESLVGENLDLDSLNLDGEDKNVTPLEPAKKDKKSKESIIAKTEAKSPQAESQSSSASKSVNIHKDLQEISGAYTLEMERLQVTIANLRQDREELLAKIQKLEDDKVMQNRSVLSLRAELDEKKIEFAILRKKLNDEITELKDKNVIAEEKKIILEEKNRILLQEVEKANQRSRLDVKKIQLREKELEQKLELLKSDTESQIRNRDLKILDLKRRIDSMEFDMETMSVQEKKSVESRFELEDKLDKAIKTLRSAITVLEDESEKNNALEVLKKNIDM